MKPYLIPLLAAVPLLGACADEAHPVLSGPATGDAQPRAAGANQTGADADWVNAVVSAKVAGSLYRIGAFFPHAPTAFGSAVALP